MPTLTFLRSEIVNDIQGCAAIAAQAVNPDSDPDSRLRALIADVASELGADRLTRVLNLGIARCREMLYTYTKGPVTEPDLNNALDQTDAYAITLNDPDGNLSQTTLDLLQHHIHEYLVAFALADYLAVVAPPTQQADLAQPWALRAAAALDNAAATLAHPLVRSRIALHWP